MKYLVVNCDDFGMTHSINVATVKAFKESILTQASIMTATPWAEEAVTMAKECNMPVGVHLNATCDFNVYRWRPFTDCPSLVDEDGFFLPRSELVKKRYDPDEIEKEYCAQIDFMLRRELKPDFIDNHMPIIAPDVMAKI